MSGSLSRLVVPALVLAFAMGVASSAGPAGSPEGSDGGRPVVLVHGFLGGPGAWTDYLGPDGYLATIDRVGYAVGGEGLDFLLDMGDVSAPAASTNTIAQNAQVLAAAIAEVRARTGARLVDVVAHSMGGLVARYYVAKVMEERDVGQLVLLGTPHGGSPCALLPAALGFYLPAALELRPSYLADIFNPQVFDLRGVPVATLAGTPIAEAIRAPCTGVPSDLVVDFGSASTLGTEVMQLPVLHTELNRSAAVFESFVAPRLLRASGELSAAEKVPAATDGAARTTHVYTGVVAPGRPVEVEIDLDAVAVASFALYDPSASLDVEVTGASGAVIDLDPDVHGLFRIAEPTSLVNLGYGFTMPRPGPWRVAVLPGPGTPTAGTEFALMARVVGGAGLSASAESVVPLLGDQVRIRATTEDVAAASARLSALVRRPDGLVTTVALRRADESGAWLGTWQPGVTGLHAIDVELSGVTSTGMAVERTAALTVEVQPARRSRGLLVAGAVLVLVATSAVVWRSARRQGSR